MKKQTNQATIKPLTPTMRRKGVTAFTSGATADTAKDAFFKAIAPRISLEQVDLYLPEFKGIAIQHYAKAHELGDRLIEELANPTLKNAAKMKGCNLTMLAIKNGTDTMARRWIKGYKHFLSTGTVQKAGDSGAKKRATKGAVKPKQTDKVELNQAPETTPLKRAIEQVTSIPRLVLNDTKPSQCSEGLRQEIEVAALMLVELLSKIK